MRLRWWKTKAEIKKLEWNAGQAMLEICKKDLAWALETDSRASWCTMVEIVKMQTDIRKRRRTGHGDH